MLPVVAVGDLGPGASLTPGNDPESLSVGASAPKGQVALFSSSQRFAHTGNTQRAVPKVVAPGEDVASTMPGGGYALLSGTAMAAAHVAGLAAVLLEAHPRATPDQVESAILSSSQRPARRGAEPTGPGIPDVETAVGALAAIGGGA
jgi:subtilisin family serine protease